MQLSEIFLNILSKISSLNFQQILAESLLKFSYCQLNELKEKIFYQKFF